jgi:hypothetical protein
MAKKKRPQTEKGDRVFRGAIGLNVTSPIKIVWVILTASLAGDSLGDQVDVLIRELDAARGRAVGAIVKVKRKVGVCEICYSFQREPRGSAGLAAFEVGVQLII